MTKKFNQITPNNLVFKWRIKINDTEKIVTLSITKIKEPNNKLIKKTYFVEQNQQYQLSMN